MFADFYFIQLKHILILYVYIQYILYIYCTLPQAREANYFLHLSELLQFI